MNKTLHPLLLLTAIALTCGCDDIDEMTMADQPRYEALESSAFFKNGLSSRQPVPGTVPRDGWPTNMYENPPQVTIELINRGQERFNINCAVCHGEDGFGEGMIVRRGFPRPPSLHDKRLRDMPDQHFFHVMTHGLGKMPAYADQVTVDDRHAIIAFIRVLQLSQDATIEDVPADKRASLNRNEEATP